jgi:hypothetical protein
VLSKDYLRSTSDLYPLASGLNIVVKQVSVPCVRH